MSEISAFHYDAATGERRQVELSEKDIALVNQIAEEGKADWNRGQRDMLLQESDWRVLPHSPSDVEAWATYRQALRDLPADPAWPDVEFPEVPA